MRIREIIAEGGWADTRTQGTVITPQTIADTMPYVEQFGKEFNQYLAKQNIPQIKMGTPVGSGAYYKQDLQQNPNKHYGDIDVSFFIPRIDGINEAAIEAMYAKHIVEFTQNKPNYDTTSGVNVIFKTNSGYIQVDLVMIFSDREDWSLLFTPERGVKGVLATSLYSALAEMLMLSISSRGIQAKTRAGELVSFRQMKDTILNQVSNNRKNWGTEVAKFLGAKKISPRLKKYPGALEGNKIVNIVQTLIGLLESLDMKDRIPELRDRYLKKVDAVINSSKFDKAASPEAKEKAASTKKMLHDKSREIAELLN